MMDLLNLEWAIVTFLTGAVFGIHAMEWWQKFLRARGWHKDQGGAP